PFLCCHGWSKSQGSQRCTMPNCIPQCHNGGMCLRPQHCVCKPGSEGKACEQKTVPTHSFPPRPGNGPTNGHNTVYACLCNVFFVFDFADFLHMLHLIVLLISLPVAQRITEVPLLSLPLVLLCAIFLAAAGNHTGRIKVVFTPTVCKLTCIGGRCHNNCERGNTTTIISENGHATDTLTAPNFRVVVCHLPCINGGKCSTRDKCQCPPNFTGKFCQMAVQNGHQQTSGGYSQNQVHSTHTLPLTYSNGQTPGIVNIHINHPPEASVQFHQVSQLDNYNNNGQQTKGSSSSTSYSYHHSESSQKIQHHGYNIVYPGQHSYQFPQYQPVTSKNALGRCFQETAGSQCGKPLPILTKLEQCCGTIGTSWGFHKCQKCPKKPSFPLIDCPQGYIRVNSSHCQDLDECQLQGVCPNGNCVNTLGSYRCICKPGYVPDPTFTMCISETPVQEEKGACFRLVSSGRQCLHPVSAQLSKQLCCCSVGKAWGPRCDKCPPPGTAVNLWYINGMLWFLAALYSNLWDPLLALKSAATLVLSCFSSGPEVDECQINPYICGHGICYNTAESYICHCDEGYHLDEAQTTCIDIDECQDQRVCVRGHCQNTEGSFSCVCGPGFRLSPAGDQCDGMIYTLYKVLSRFHITPTGVSHGNPLYEALDSLYGMTHIFLCSRCVFPDVDECADDTELCSPHGKCLNTEGSYLCVCDSGFTASLDMPSCDGKMQCSVSIQLNPLHSIFNFHLISSICLEENKGRCRRNVCVCIQGWSKSQKRELMLFIWFSDIDECGLNETICGPHGFCENRLGSYRCLCDQGYQESRDGHGCVDVDECELLSSVCGEAQCVNRDGTFQCECPSGQEYNVMIAKCEPIPTAPLVEHKECYYHLNDENLCESVLTSHVTLQECCCTLGAGWGDNCEVHPCPVNGTDQFNQMCPSGRGFIPNGDLLYGVPTSDVYRDADECSLFGQEVCKGGFCLNTEGSYECYCKTGHDYDPIKLECRDIDECLDESLCIDGQCLNTDGSYMCLCISPMVLDPIGNRCIFHPEVAEEIDYGGICWQEVRNMMCINPLGPNQKTTYTECCCLHGYAWGLQCALCPPRDTEDYASMCNLPLSGGRRPYGRDALVADPYRAFEGLRAEECGILNGCENGRCVRVQEGYTCDCFDGYTLDLPRMTCIDVNECLELNNRMSLCKNARCINNVGSYQCVCLPGFKASDKPNYCVEAEKHQISTHTQ
uniref:Latent transforming growth factor beta binding protein 1 n=1 Tax=Oreochromis niloticus TaxID=8128 RepID=A0A669BX74_ORENI